MLRKALLVLSPLLASIMFAQTVSPTAPSGPSQPLIILIGPPLSGKTTFADAISRTYRIPSISIEDLIRDNAAELNKLRGEGISLAEMRYDPAMSRYIRERLKSADLSRGITLDGYPATLAQAEDLRDMFADLKLKLIALRLQVPDDTIRERAKTTGRESDRPQIIEQRIKDYHREMDAISLYFPNAKIVDIDGSLPEAKAWNAIQTVLDEAGIKAVAK
jgi:adenylate kinase family enzyme